MTSQKKLLKTKITVQGDLAQRFAPQEVYFSWEADVIINSDYEVEDVRVQFSHAYTSVGEEIELEADANTIERIEEQAAELAMEKVHSSDFDDECEEE